MIWQTLSLLLYGLGAMTTWALLVVAADLSQHVRRGDPDLQDPAKRVMASILWPAIGFLLLLLLFNDSDWQERR